jgi:two-component system cell cycle response regulator
MGPRTVVRRFAFQALIAGLAVHLAHALTRFGGATVDNLVENWLYSGLEFVAVALCAWRAAALRAHRAGWTLIAVGLLLWAAGDLAWTLLFNTTADPPFPNVCDLFYFSAYSVLYAGLVVLLRARVRHWPASLSIDGLVAGLALAALAAGAVFEPVRRATTGSTAVVATTLGYPVCDLLLLVIVVLAFAVSGWRPGRAWWLLGGGLVSMATADSIYAYQQSASDYAGGGVLDTLWPLGFVVVALAAWQPDTPRQRSYVTWAGAAVPVAGTIVAIGVLVHAGLQHGGPVDVGLAGAALLAGIGRSLLMMRENFGLLQRARLDATTDKLTELPNRRALVADLDAVCEALGDGRHHTLAFFDLDGFKDYNDAFGHPAGDALLRRLAPALALVGGRAYRLGGDEFCLMLDGALGEGDARIDAAIAALSERGDGFSIGASFGLVVLPDDARDATEALRLADERMYARKRRRRAGHRGQARDVLVQVMAERQPGLDDHNSGVARLAAAAGRLLALDAEELDVLVRAAELHDVGKVAVPDEILHKPGPLDAGEWAIMRQHMVAGERILGVAESMRPVARIVRTSHERWDGRGYPDGLAGEAIPLGARIVCACDALDAMLSRRPYKPPLPLEEALAELRRWP